MIIIIRALSHARKNEKRPKMPTEMKKERSKSPNKKREREKKREGTMLLSFSPLVLHNSTMFFMIESLFFCHDHILVGIFII